MVSSYCKSSLQLPPGKSFLCYGGGVVNGGCFTMEPLLEGFTVFTDVVKQPGQLGLFLCPKSGPEYLGQGSRAL